MKNICLFVLFIFINDFLYSQELTKLDFAYQKGDSLVFYGNTSNSLRCLVSGNLYISCAENRINATIFNLDIEGYHPVVISTSKRLEPVLCTSKYNLVCNTIESNLKPLLLKKKYSF